MAAPGVGELVILGEAWLVVRARLTSGLGPPSIVRLTPWGATGELAQTVSRRQDHLLFGDGAGKPINRIAC